MGASQQALFMRAAAASLPTVTWNPLDKDSNVTLSNGDMTATLTAAVNVKCVRATRGIDAATGNGYFEVRCDEENLFSPYMTWGFGRSTATLANAVGSGADSWGYYMETGQKVNSSNYVSYGAGWSEGSVIGFALKNGKLWFSKNGVWQGGGDPAAGTGEAFSGVTGVLYPQIALWGQTHQATGRFNEADCTYEAPAGINYWGG